MLTPAYQWQNFPEVERVRRTRKAEKLLREILSLVPAEILFRLITSLINHTEGEH